MVLDINEEKENIPFAFKERSRMWRECDKIKTQVTKIKYSLEAIKCKFFTTKYLNQCFRVKTWEEIWECKVNE